MEAQMTLGHFYLVHRRIILQRLSLKTKQETEHYIIDYYCHIYFLFQEYGDDEHKPTDRKSLRQPKTLEI